jgi:acylphosphatase
MSRCLKITVRATGWQSKWHDKIADSAKKLEIEGVLQTVDEETVKIIACGAEDHLDDFLDDLYELFADSQSYVEEMEPFVKDRDYRGIFRVL